MALQMGASLALAFVLGRWLFAQHWSWVVMTAFVVSSGNRGRGDVVYKSGLRIIGAAAGTVAATFLSGALAPRDAATVVVIFVVLGVATWLRSFSYAYWAAAITSVLSLLYGYFGESGARYLPDRLEGIAVGAAIAVAVAWLVMPVRTAEVLRRRLADVLAALSDVLAALGGEQPELASRAERFEHALAALEEVAKPVEVHRLLTRAWRHGGHIADAIDGARGCREPVAGIVALAARSPDELANPEVERHRRRAASRVGAARRALAGRRLESDVSSKPADQPPPPASSPLVAALTQLEAPMARIEGHYTAGSR